MILPRPSAPRLAAGFALAAAPALAADPAPGAAGMLQTLPALGLVLVVIVEVGEQWLVLGVAPGSVRRLSRLARPQTVATPVPESAGAAHPFAAWLDRARART